MTKFIVLSIIGGYLISLILWDKIVLPFNNPYNAVGKLTLLEFDPINNYVRWVVFVFTPAALFCTLVAITHNFKKIKKHECTKDDGYLLITVGLAVAILFYRFFTHAWSTDAFDIFHEGEQVTPAFIYLLGKGIWSGTFFVHGAIYDLFTALAGWKFFGITSVGAYRVSVLFFELLKDLSLVLLLYILGHTFKKTECFIVFFYVATLRFHNIDRRNISLILILCLLFWNGKSRFFYFVSGILCAIGYLYSLDVGIYSTLLIIFFLAVSRFYNTTTFKQTLFNLDFFLAGGFFMLIIFHYIFGKTELMFFFNNFLYILKTKDLIDSYVYPFPNLLEFPRTTLPLIFSVINVLILIVFTFGTYLRDPKCNKLATVHTTLVFVSLLLYRSALGRSDLTHIEYSSSFIFIALGLSVGLLINKQPFYANAFLWLVLIVLGTIHTNPRNIFTFSQRINQFVQKDNLAFISPSSQSGIKRLNQIFKDESCILNLTSQAALPYLLNKPVCGRLYISYLASAEPLRQEFFALIQKLVPKFIIYSSHSWTQNIDNITNYQRFPNIMQYIDKNYEIYEVVSNYWTIYRHKQN